jgi:hypothetical protein
MFIEAELQFRHYSPEKIEPGMLFMTHINPGHPDKEHVQVWKITEDYFHDQLTDEILIEENGYPVRPFIMNDDLIVTPGEIGTFVIFHDDDTEGFVEFGVTEMNFILREFDGWLEVLIDEDTLDDRLIEPIYDEENNNKVIIKFIDEEEEEEDYINDEEE